MLNLHNLLCFILISSMEVMEWQELVFTFSIVIFTNNRICRYMFYNWYDRYR